MKPYAFRAFAQPVRLLALSGLAVFGLLALLVSIRAQPPMTTAPAVWYVDAGVGTGAPHNGLTWSTAFMNLDAAITAAAAGDSIWCAEGSYKPPPVPPQTVVSTGFHINKSLQIYGGFKGPHGGFPAELTLDQRHGSFLATILEGDTLFDDLVGGGTYNDNARHLIDIDGTSGGVHVVIDGFKIERGYCLFANTTTTPQLPADDGAGIKCYLADLDVANVTFERDYASHGGGIWISGGIVFPPAQGAGVFPTLHVKTSEFLDDHADFQGGGLFADMVNDSWVVNTRFDACLATTGGGGAYLRAVKNLKNFDFVNSVFWQNQSHDNGGALNFDYATSSPDGFAKSRVVNCTLVGNFISFCNAGQAVVVSQYAQIGIYNSILFYNYDISQGNPCGTAPDSIGGVGSPVVQYSDVYTQSGVFTGTGNLNTSPLFRSGNPPPATPPIYVVGPLFKLLGASSTTLGSDCIDAADYGRLPDDLGDLNNDGVTVGQKLPVDLLELNRFVNRTGMGENDVGAPLPNQGYLDMGAYEQQP